LLRPPPVETTRHAEAAVSSASRRQLITTQDLLRHFPWMPNILQHSQSNEQLLPGFRQQVSGADALHGRQIFAIPVQHLPWFDVHWPALVQ
jgi:hypothetical protein